MADSEYDNTDRIVLFKSKSDHPKAPAHVGSIELGSETFASLAKQMLPAKVSEKLESVPIKTNGKLDVSIWEGKVLSGSIKPPYKLNQPAEPSDEPW
jgi:hypothetical protein